MRQVKVQLSDAVRTILAGAEIEGNTLRIRQQLSRPLYLEVNKALVALGGKWITKAQRHVFATDPRELIEAGVKTSQVVDAKKTFCAFFTPPAVGEMLVRYSNVRPGDLVLEPSAGDGSLVKLIFSVTGRIPHVCEIQPELREQLRSLGCEIKADDFLSYKPGRIYDVIIANPPFSDDQGVDHINHMLNLLKSGGRLVSVLGAGFKFRQDKKYKLLRQRLDEETTWSLIDLQEHVFSESGTEVRTCILSCETTEFRLT